MTEDRDAWEETARQFEATYKSEVVDVQNQLRQERDTVAEQKYLMGLASEHRDKLEEQVAQLNTKLGDQGTAIHAYILELSKAEAQIVQLQTTVGQLRETIERAFNAKIHPFQTDEGRDYCQCGYYKVHPIHALAALATCPAPEAVGQPPL
jgi:chromosome segregation ATPase